MPDEESTIQAAFNENSPLLLVYPYTPEQMSCEERPNALNLNTFKQIVSMYSDHHQLGHTWIIGNIVLLHGPEEKLNAIHSDLEPRYYIRTITSKEYKRHKEARAQIIAAEHAAMGKRTLPNSALH